MVEAILRKKEKKNIPYIPTTSFDEGNARKSG